MENNIYKKLKRKNIPGINLGFSFSFLVLENIRNLELKSSINVSDLHELIVYDFEKDENVHIKVNPQEFQTNLHELYRNFIDDFFSLKFKWCLDASNSIKNTMKVEFGYDSLNIFKYFRRVILESLSIYSSGSNFYEYKNFFNYIKKSFVIAGFSDTESANFAIVLISGLIKDSLIIFDEEEEHFTLRDQIFDYIVYFSSMFLPRVFKLEESKFIIHNSVEDLNRLSFLIDSFIDQKLLKSKLSPSSLNILKESFPEIYNTVNDDTILLTEFPEASDYDIQVFLKSRIAFNEFCFVVSSMVCFSNYYNLVQFKNMLDSDRNPLF